MLMFNNAKVRVLYSAMLSSKLEKLKLLYQYLNTQVIVFCFIILGVPRHPTFRRPDDLRTTLVHHKTQLLTIIKRLMCQILTTLFYTKQFYISGVASSISGGGGGGVRLGGRGIFIYLCSAQLISFEIDCFY